MFNLHTKNISAKVTLRDLPTLRQAFVVASLLIVVGTTLALTVNSYFIILTFLVAGGLMFSGLSGVCPMVLILQAMPWNKYSSKAVEEGESERHQ
jgi:hypothetical protein